MFLKQIKYFVTVADEMIKETVRIGVMIIVDYETQKELAASAGTVV